MLARGCHSERILCRSRPQLISKLAGGWESKHTLSTFWHHLIVGFLLQIWRPLAGPVDDSPLAMADAATVEQSDLLTNTLHFPGRTGEVYAVAHNPAHK